MNDTKQKMKLLHLPLSEFTQKTATNFASSTFSSKLYYDSYEKDFGDGFYPSTTKSDPCTTEIDITFMLDLSNHYWIQTNCTNINGLDGDEGYKLLTLLNESIPEKQFKINGMNSIDVVEGVGIVNSLGEILYPKNCA